MFLGLKTCACVRMAGGRLKPPNPQGVTGM